MKTKAVRLYGKNDLRLEEFELPKIKDNEILAKVVCDSICMSSYKASHEADIHKRVPRDIAQRPVIIGHEFAGELVEVGSKWSKQFKAGDKFSIQPALNYEKGPVGVILPRFAVRTAVVRDRRDACELPHHARVVQTRDGDQTRRQHGGTRRRGPDGVGRHQLRHPPHRPQTEADRGDRYRPDASGSRRIALFARGSR